MEENNDSRILWFYPIPKNRYAINLSASETLSLNSAFMEKVFGQTLMFGYDEVDHAIHIRQTEDGFNLRKNGMIRHNGFISAILESGVRAPARFSVSKHEEGWIAHLTAQKPVVFKAKRKPRTPSGTAMNSL